MAAEAAPAAPAAPAPAPAPDMRRPPERKYDVVRDQNLTPEQAAKLEQFREAAKHVTSDDADLIRFLRARQYDIPAALKQLEGAYQWRKEYGADHILENIPASSALVKSIIPHAFHKWDKDGRPMYIERTGRINVPFLLNLVPKKELLHNHVIGLEYQLLRCRQSSAERGKLIVNVCIIMDLTGLNPSHKRGMDFLKFITELDQRVYPESMGMLFVVNAPWFFSALWAIARLWLDDRTRNKIHILGSNYKEVLLRHIPAENLPVEFGGTDPFVVPHADPNVVGHLKIESFDPPLQELPIAAGEKKSVKLPVRRSGANVSWFFRTASKDIRFAASFKPAHPDAAEMVLVHPQRFDADQARVEGSYECKQEGEVHFVWDNSYSYFTGKVVRFHIEALHHDEQHHARLEAAAQQHAQGAASEGKDAHADKQST